MTKKETQPQFPSIDPAGITPGHDVGVTKPPEPRTSVNRGSRNKASNPGRPDDDDAPTDGTPETGLVSIGTSSSSEAA